MSHPAPVLGFDQWLRAISASIEAAVESDLAAAAELARIARELTNRSHRRDPPRSGAETVRPSAADPTPLVRPYALPGEPARSAPGIAVEALVTATGRGNLEAPTTGGEWRRIVELCQQARSLAEIAAHRGLPLGAARAVVGEMAAAGLLDVQEPARLDEGGRRYLTERVLRGLYRL